MLEFLSLYFHLHLKYCLLALEMTLLAEVNMYFLVTLLLLAFFFVCF